MISKNVKDDIKYIAIGSFIFVLVCILVVIFYNIFFSNFNLLNVFIIIVSLTIGYFLGILTIINMAHNIDATLYFQDIEKAKSYMIKYNILRYVIISIITIFMSLKFGIFSGLSIIIGIYGIKIGAYLVPIFKKIKNKEV